MHQSGGARDYVAETDCSMITLQPTNNTSTNSEGKEKRPF
jgi:hypothetical protein